MDPGLDPGKGGAAAVVMILSKWWILWVVTVEAGDFSVNRKSAD